MHALSSNKNLMRKRNSLTSMDSSNFKSTMEAVSIHNDYGSQDDSLDIVVGSEEIVHSDHHDEDFKVIFKIEKVKMCKNRSIRRDVFNKKIVRSFKKFFKTYLGVRILCKRQTQNDCVASPAKSILMMTHNQQMVNNAWTEKGIIFADICGSDQGQELLEFLTWNSTPMMYQKKHGLFISKTNCAINLFKDLSNSYSHSKLQTFFKNHTMKVLFRIFVDEMKQELIGGTKEESRDDFISCIDDFEINFQC